MSNPIHSERKLLETDVHIWSIPLAVASPLVGRYTLLLTPDEQARAARFHFEIDRTRFVIARARMRILLASYLGCAPAVLAFSYSPHGKPYLNESPLSFNLSHAHERALLGITVNRAVGVDVEYVRADFAIEEVAERYFSADELRVLRSFPLEQRAAAFFRCWTRKEAYIKARGEGLSMPLADFTVCLQANERVRLINHQDPREQERWELLNIPCGDGGYVAAIAVEGHNLRFEYFNWNDNEAFS
jgi:4'-phosphopantetheinyl transferase